MSREEHIWRNIEFSFMTEWFHSSSVSCSTGIINSKRTLQMRETMVTFVERCFFVILTVQWKHGVKDLALHLSSTLRGTAHPQPLVQTHSGDDSISSVGWLLPLGQGGGGDDTDPAAQCQKIPQQLETWVGHADFVPLVWSDSFLQQLLVKWLWQVVLSLLSFCCTLYFTVGPLWASLTSQHSLTTVELSSSSFSLILLCWFVCPSLSWAEVFCLSGSVRLLFRVSPVWSLGPA